MMTINGNDLTDGVNDNKERKFCPECQVGVFHYAGATYFTWLDDELVTVQNFPCWVCDVCGHRDWDTHALLRLNILLSPNVGTPTAKIHNPAGMEKPSVRSKKRITHPLH